MKHKLKELIDQAPPGHFHPKIQTNLAEVKRRLEHAATLMDDLGLLDERSQDVYVDENSLRKLLREASPGSEDGVIERLRRIPGSRLTRDSQGLKKVPWETVAQRMVSGTVTPSLAPGPYASFDEIRQAIQQGRPDIPDSAFEPETLRQASEAVLGAPAPTQADAAFGISEAVWNCMVNHGGFWSALALVADAFFMIAIAVVLATFDILFVLTFWSLLWPVFTAMFPWGVAVNIRLVLICIANPSA